MDMLSLIWNHRKETDLVLIDTYGAQNFYYAYSVGKLCQQLDLPYIPILHGGNLRERLEKSPGQSKSLFGNAKLNVAPSHFLFDIFESAGFKNLRIIPNSITLGSFPFKEREEFHPSYLWVRRFQERYNPMMCVRVFEELKKKFPSAKLCMIGPEKDGSLEKCNSYSKEKNLGIEFPGKLKKSEWAELSKQYDFFLNTTHVDNTPISVIEAMALGLPVISTNVGGMRYLIQNGKEGILVQENDVSGMVRAAVNLLEDEQKAKQIAVAARKKVEGFDWEVVKPQWVEVLNS